jgi:signal transduction histidine kinase
LSFSLNILLLTRHQRQPKSRRKIASRPEAIPSATSPRTELPTPEDSPIFAELQARFILMVSHEYRTPLTTILTTTELLERYGNKITDQNKQRYTQRIKQSVQHLIKLLNDTLLLDHDSIPLIIQPLELTGFCDSLLHDTAHDSLTLVHHFDNLPREPIATDEILLRQVLTRLLSNGIKFSPSSLNNPRPIVKFEVLYQPFSPSLSNEPRPDGLLIFKITDFGIGIPDRDRALIFDRFCQGSNIGTIGGTGLGLTLARSDIDRLGGTLQLTSQENQGTTVRVSLPIHYANHHAKATDSIKSS